MKTRGFKLLEENAIIPTRATSNSAGYDFYVPKGNADYAVFPGETVKIPTNVAAYMQSDEVLTIHVRSSIGIKKGLVLANSTGIIDSDYYDNPDNGGNIIIVLRNCGDEVQVVHPGDRIAQGVFVKYLTVDNDAPLSESREGGIGSTGTK